MLLKRIGLFFLFWALAISLFYAAAYVNPIHPLAYVEHNVSSVALLFLKFATLVFLVLGAIAAIFCAFIVPLVVNEKGGVKQDSSLGRD